jgi:acetyl esterase/lipase
MKSMLRWIAGIALVLILIAGGLAGKFIFLDGRAPAKRPDLVRLPANAPPAPKGYPTFNAVKLAFVAGRLDMLSTEGDIQIPADVVVERPIEYGKVGDTLLLLDLYSPKALDAPAPGLIFIHGGGWTKGHRNDYQLYTIPFAQRGYVVATISYRFAQVAKFPGCVEDAKCAVRWMRANAEKLNVDPDRIAVIGGSAGGYLTLMAGYSADVPELEGAGGHPDVSSKPNAIIDIYGPVDLTTEYARNSREVGRFLPKSYEEDPALYSLASPLFHLDADDPPTLVIQGTIDELVPVSQSDRLVEKLQELGIPHYYVRLDGWPHTMDVVPQVNEYTQWVMNAFLEEHLKGKS